MTNEEAQEPVVEEAPPAPQEVDPQLKLAAEQEQAEADAAQLRHLRGRVPLLRLELNKALIREHLLEQRVAELESQLSIKQPQDHRPPAKKTVAKKTTAKKRS